MSKRLLVGIGLPLGLGIGLIFLSCRGESRREEGGIPPSTHSSHSSPSEIKWAEAKLPKEAKVVEMPPLDFLDRVPSPCREGYTAKEDMSIKSCFSESSLKFIEAQIREGKPLEVPFLDYERIFRGFPTHEGRHTALVAHRMGIQRIPVIIFGGIPTHSSPNPRSLGDLSAIDRFIADEYSDTQKYGSAVTSLKNPEARELSAKLSSEEMHHATP